MPNWCENRLEIQGTAEDIAAIVQLCKLDKGEFDFNGFVPMPESLNVESGSRLENGYEALYEDWRRIAEWVMLRLKPEGVPDASVSVGPFDERKELIAFIEKYPDKCDFVSLPLGRQAKDNLEKYGATT